VKQHTTYDIREDGHLNFKCVALTMMQVYEVGHCGNNSAPIETFTKVALISVEIND
jgi:hypothetical protein